MPEQNLASGGWSCWGNIRFCFLGKLCEIFFLTWNPITKKKKNCEQNRFYSTWGRSLRSQAETRPLNLLLPKQCLSWPIPAVSPPVFKLQPLALPDISWSDTAFQQVFTMFSNCRLTVSRSLDHLLPNPAVAIPLWDPPSSQASHKSLSQEVRAPPGPMEVIREPFQTIFPFQPRFLEIAACPHLDNLPDMRQTKPLKLFPWHSELLFFNANCCLGIWIWNGFAFP